MVSTASSSTQKQPLSYADSARKAQGIHNPTSPTIQRRPPQQPSVAASSSSTTSSQVGDSAIISGVNARPVPAADAPSLISAASPKVTEGTTGTNEGSHPPFDLMASSSSAPANKASSAPVVNVWNVRKERMAQAHSQPSTSSQASSILATQKQLNSSHQAESSHVSESSESTRNTSSAPSLNGSQRHHAPSDSTPMPSGNFSVVSQPRISKGDDPWSVRPSAAQTVVPPLLHLDDAAAWPEVGKAVPSASASSSRSRSVAERDVEDAKEDEQEKGDDHTAQRKSEQTFLFVFSTYHVARNAGLFYLLGRDTVGDGRVVQPVSSSFLFLPFHSDCSFHR